MVICCNAGLALVQHEEGFLRRRTMVSLDRRIHSHRAQVLLELSDLAVVPPSLHLAVRLRARSLYLLATTLLSTRSLPLMTLGGDLCLYQMGRHPPYLRLANCGSIARVDTMTTLKTLKSAFPYARPF